MKNVFVKLIKAKRLSDMTHLEKKLAKDKASNLSSLPPLKLMNYILRTNESQTQKDDLLEFEVLNLPDWCSDYKEFSTECYQRERRKGVLYRHFIIPLPSPISIHKIKPAVYGFVHYIANKHFNSKIPLIWALHKGVDKDFPHIHILLHDRSIDTKSSKETFFTQKNPKIKKMNLLGSSFLDDIKQSWVDFVNPHLLASDQLQFQKKTKKYQTDSGEIRVSPKLTQHMQSNSKQDNYRNSYEFTDLSYDEIKANLLNGITMNMDSILKDGFNFSQKTNHTFDATQELENSYHRHH